MVVPKHIKTFIWDTPKENLESLKNPRFIIERIAEYGDFTAINWLKSSYAPEEIISSVQSSRYLSPKSANFFALLFQIPKSSIFALNHPFKNKAERFN